MAGDRDAPEAGPNLPANSLNQMGYETQVLPSSRPHLGVAVLSHRDRSHKPVVETRDLPGVQRDARFLTVEIGGLWVSSVYAPYGGPGHKGPIQKRIACSMSCGTTLTNEGYAHRDSLLCGDFNVKFRADGPRMGT